MIKSKFLKILRSFTSEELKSFSKFIRSPYFNTNKSIVSLFNYLKINSCNFSKIDENRIFRNIYPGKQFNRKRLRELSSQMLSLCELFLSVQNFKSSEFDVKLNLLKSLNYHKLPVLFINYHKTISGDINNKFINIEHFNRLTVLKKEYFNFCNTNNFIGTSDNINTTINDVYKSTALEILRCSTSLEIIKKEFNLEYNKVPSAEIIEILDKYSFFGDPLIEIYYYLYTLANRSGMSLFRKVLEIFNSNKNNYDNDIKKEILTTLINHLLIYESENKEIDFVQELYNIYTMMYNSNLFLDDNGLMVLNLYHNYSDTLLILNKLSEYLDFYKYSKDKFGIEKTNTDTINYFHGRYYFKIQDRNKALYYFEKISNYDIKLSLEKRLYMMYIYYENSDFDKFELFTAAFNKFISRKSKSYKILVNEYKLTLDYLQKLNNCDDNNSLKELLCEINNNTSVFYKKWIKEKINEKLIN